MFQLTLSSVGASNSSTANASARFTNALHSPLYLPPDSYVAVSKITFRKTWLTRRATEPLEHFIAIEDAAPYVTKAAEDTSHDIILNGDGEKNIHDDETITKVFDSLLLAIQNAIDKDGYYKSLIQLFANHVEKVQQFKAELAAFADSPSLFEKYKQRIIPITTQADFLSAIEALGWTLRRERAKLLHIFKAISFKQGSAEQLLITNVSKSVPYQFYILERLSDVYTFKAAVHKVLQREARTRSFTAENRVKRDTPEVISFFKQRYRQLNALLISSSCAKFSNVGQHQRRLVGVVPVSSFVAFGAHQTLTFDKPEYYPATTGYCDYIDITIHDVNGQLVPLTGIVQISLSFIFGSTMNNRYPLTLLSNAKSKTSIENTVANFVNQLYKPIKLSAHEQYEMGLKKVIYTKSWPNLPLQETLSVEWHFPAAAKFHELQNTACVIDRGNYTQEELVALVNAKIEEVLDKITGDKIAKKPTLAIDSTGNVVETPGSLRGYVIKGEWAYFDLFIKMSEHLRKVLGARNDFHKDVYRDHAAGINALMFYSNIVDYSLVADTQAQLLGIVDVATEHSYGDVVTRTFPNPIYYRLKDNFIENVEISIKDDSGGTVPFDSGRVILVVEIRRVKN